MRTRRDRNLAKPAPAPDIPPQTSDQIFDDLQWSDLSFTKEDMGEWSQIQMNTEDKEEEVKDAEAKVPLKEEEAENIITLPVELAMDVSFHFTTEKVFDSRDAVIQWCQDVGRELKMVVTVVKNDKPYKGRRGRLVLGCERRGIDRSRRKSTANKTKPRQNLGASKCNCPFELKGEAIDGDKWKLEVSCGLHNHELQEALAEDARDEEKKVLVDVTTMPVEAVMSLECQDAESFSKAIVRVGDADGKDAMSLQDSQSCPQASGRDQLNERPPPYKHIERNEFSYRKHKKQKEEDIVICECRYDADDPNSACGDECLNVLTSTECTPSRCPCGNYCKNQKFQKCEYVRTKLFKSEGRGWGLLAEENIKAGQFVIEYCGEVISCKAAKRRSQTYEAQGLKDAYIIYLNANESIDATRKGSLARFINHSCQPNCETRKWTVLGEIRVGIFAKHDIPVGTELAYDYNFEWYGGAKVRCLCGSPGCSEFLGAKSRGFQEATYLWEDDDDRYSIENVPISAPGPLPSQSVKHRISPFSHPPFPPLGSRDRIHSSCSISLSLSRSMAEEQRLQKGHRLCANNCGFFGSPATNDLCSKCYRDLRHKEERASSAKIAVEKSLLPPSSSSLPPPPAAAAAYPATGSGDVLKAALPPAAGEERSPAPQQPGRCTAAACRKRVGLVGFRCRCGATYCGAHRYPEQHGCTFDFKEVGREAIARANPVVKADKLDGRI